MQQFIQYWKQCTSDHKILYDVTGLALNFTEKPTQNNPPEVYQFNKAKCRKIDAKIAEFLNKGIVEPASPEPDQFVSNIFTKDKPDGDIRILIDLTELNKFIPHEHFKMEDINTVKQLVSRGCYMASIDWKDAYYSVNVRREYRKYLRFIWNNKLLQFTCLPNGLRSGPRSFTKMSKVLFSQARKEGATASAFIDDSFLVDDNKQQTRANVKTVIAISDKSGFIFHPIKSVLDPTQELIHLGYVINSIHMTLRLTMERIQKIQHHCQNLLLAIETKGSCKIQQLAQLTGLMVSSFSANQYGMLMYRRCDNHKNKMLQENKGNFNAKITLPENCIEDIKLWDTEIASAYSPIIREEPTITLESDASNQGWGGVLINSGENLKTGGNWTPREKLKHNNYLELKAACLTIKSFCNNMKNTHIKILTDNTTTMNYLEKQGGRKPALNELTREIWLWAKHQNNWISANHLPGEHNIEADQESRKKHEHLEWKLAHNIFQKLVQTWGKPDIDLFASRQNYQVPKYASWKPDPGAWAVDALSFKWENLFGYAFPPFALIGKVLQKMKHEQATLILVCPDWTTQPWYTNVKKHLIADPIYFSSHGTLHHPTDKTATFPARKMIAASLSGNPTLIRAYQDQQKTSS